MDRSDRKSTERAIALLTGAVMTDAERQKLMLRSAKANAELERLRKIIAADPALAECVKKIQRLNREAASLRALQSDLHEETAAIRQETQKHLRRANRAEGGEE